MRMSDRRPEGKEGPGLAEEHLSETDQTLADSDQTLADRDQTASDLDQQASEDDQAAADLDDAEHGQGAKHERTSAVRAEAARDRGDRTSARSNNPGARCPRAAT